MDVQKMIQRSLVMTILIAFLLAKAFSLSGCGRAFDSESRSLFVLLPWPNDKGEYHLQKVPVRTLPHLHELSGPVARIYWQAGNQGQKGFRGKPVRPHVTRRGPLWVPLDVQSQQGISLYAVLERLYDFDQSLGFSSRLLWPRSIGFEIRLQTLNGAMLNNAIYDTSTDLIAVTGFQKREGIGGLPPGLNHGIMAHEHFHAHFAAAMAKHLHLLTEHYASDYRATNLISYGAWNEGLADFYATVFTGRPHFMAETFLGQETWRGLEGAVYPLQTWAELQVKSVPGEAQAAFYRNGTAIARWLYHWGKELDPVAGERLVLREVLKQLPHILEATNADFLKRAVAPSEFVRKFLQLQSLVLPSRACQELQLLLRFEVSKEGAQCL